MKKIIRINVFFPAIGMLLLIFKSGTAAAGIRAGVEVCLYRLIPSIFPFLILSGSLTSAMAGRNVGFFAPVRRLCRIPSGSESLLMTGFLAGYPVGAGNVAQMYRNGRLSESDAARMVVFCNNAGPAFLFGVLGPLFSAKGTLWLLWAVQIAAAILCAAVLPGGSSCKMVIPQGRGTSITQSVTSAVKTMGIICGWVLLFRMVLEFLDLWVFGFFPDWVQVLVTGLLELSNGCVRLELLGNEDLRFVLASVMLSSGGLCVWMQTASVCDSLDMQLYLPGKLLQTGLSAVLSIAVIILRNRFSHRALLILPGILLFSFLFLRNRLSGTKKEVAI